MNLPTRTAVRSLKCKSTWLTVEVWETSEVTQVPSHNGTYYGIFCELKIIGSEREFLRVGVGPDVYTHLSVDESKLLLAWLPKAGFAALIEVLCDRRQPEPEHLVYVIPKTLTSDPQKANMRFFRRRCRYDVLRFLNDRLMKAGPGIRVSSDEIMASPLLTRLYDTEDVNAALQYWHRERILIQPTFGPAYSVDELSDERVAELVAGYDWEETLTNLPDTPLRKAAKRADVFICHASEDKEDFVRALAHALQQRNLAVWYDEFTLKLGDSLRLSIDAGLSNARYGIVVLSPAFFAKKWPQYELDGLAQKEMSGGEKVILPVWHGVDKETVENYSPSLAGRVAVLTSAGLEEVVSKVLEVTRPAGATPPAATLITSPVPASIKSVPTAPASPLTITYEYDSLAVAVGAKAYSGKVLLGNARKVELVKGEYIEIEEEHYSPAGDGTVVYIGHVRFAISGGIKLGESPKAGTKAMDIFLGWPI